MTFFPARRGKILMAKAVVLSLRTLDICYDIVPILLIIDSQRHHDLRWVGQPLLRVCIGHNFDSEELFS